MLIDEFLDTDALAETDEVLKPTKSPSSNEPEPDKKSNLATLKLMIIENRKIIHELEVKKRRSLATFEGVKDEMKELKTRYDEYITRNEADDNSVFTIESM